MKKMNIEDKLFLNRFQADTHSHLKIKDSGKCIDCERRPCTYICPAAVYAWDEKEQRIDTAYEGCLECGTCKYGCAHDNIDWRNPRGGFGVMYKNG